MNENKHSNGVIRILPLGKVDNLLYRTRILHAFGMLTLWVYKIVDFYSNLQTNYNLNTWLCTA